MSIYKVTGSVLDLSGDAAVYLMNQIRYIRAGNATLARLIFQRAFNGVADHVAMVGANYSAHVGSARVYDGIVNDPTDIDAIKSGIYKPTTRAAARCVAISKARAETGAARAVARAMRRIVELQRKAGQPIHVKA